jgi:hypothetical protein
MLKHRIHSTLINFWQAVHGHRPVRGRGPRAPRPLAGARALALERHRLGGADRRPRAPDLRDQPPPQGRPRRSPLHPAAHERARDRLGARVHDRRRDRRDRALLIAREADRLHRPQPARHQSGDSDPRAFEQSRPSLPALGAHRGDDAPLKHPAYSARYQRNKRRLGKQRGAKVAQINIARRLAHAIWHMLSRNEKFAPRGAALRLAA